jgi:hypothetical protein
MPGCTHRLLGNHGGDQASASKEQIDDTVRIQHPHFSIVPPLATTDVYVMQIDPGRPLST